MTRTSSPSRGVHAGLASLAFLLLAAGGLGLAIGLYGKLEPCPGSCSETVTPVTSSDFYMAPLIAGGAGVLLGLVLLVVVVARSRRPIPASDRAEVRGERIRVCPTCSTQSQTEGEFCPHCGASFTRAPGMPRTLKAAVLGAVGALLLAAAAAGTLVYANSVEDQKDRRVRLARAFQDKQQKEQAAEAKRAARDVEVSLRRDTVEDVEKSITEDMRKRAQEEFSIVEGPILGTQCTPTAGSDIEDLDEATIELDCLAYNKREGTQLSGTSVSATVDFDSGRYTWQIGR